MDDVSEWGKIDKEIKKETRGDQSSSSEAPYFILLWAFIPWVIHTARWKMQSQLNIPSVITFIHIRFLPARVLFFVHHLLSQRPVDIPWPLFDKFWSARTIIFPGNGTPLQYSCLENPMDGGAWKAAVHGVAEGWTRLSDFTFTFHFHALEKEMATHSSVLAWRIPGTREPGGLPSLGSHRVRHDWSDLAAAAAAKCFFLNS